MSSIDTLSKTTFSGRRFTRKQLASVQELTEMFGNLSRQELALTVCEQLNWVSPSGRNKLNSCLTLLEALEAEGVISLPAKRVVKASKRKVPSFEEHPPTPSIEGTLESIGPIKLLPITTDEGRREWQAYVQTHHYLEYKQPFGSYLYYFVVSQSGQKLGCLSFSASAAWALAPRDEWIGWDKQYREKHLYLVLSNDRFLIFPWVTISNLASHVLSHAVKRIGDDWLKAYSYRPVLIETFVDTTRFTGTCYRAANWIGLGKTKGRSRVSSKPQDEQTKKDIFVYPLQSDWKERLTSHLSIDSQRKKNRTDLRAIQTKSVDSSFQTLWGNIVQILHEVAKEYDDKWRLRKRVIDTMMLLMLIFRLVTSKNKQSYGTTIDDFWSNCDRVKFVFPQEKSIASSSFCAARKKLDENVFKCANQRILEAYEQNSLQYTWNGHRLFAVDGSKLNLPRKLLDCDYSLPTKVAHYPQGLLSCLYQVKSQLPFDFDLVSHGNERKCAQQHLNVLRDGDVVVYDRGYYSYEMLHRHYRTGIHAIFRLKRTTNTVVKAFFDSTEKDKLVSITVGRQKRLELIKENPHLDFKPLKVRLIKYDVGGTTYCLGTTLIAPHQQYTIQEYMDVYHSRWGVEELYKVSKQVFDIQDFHAKSERGVKQEVFAHFVLITMSRLFANQSDNQINGIEPEFPFGPQKPLDEENKIEKRRTNFKNCIHVVTRSLEELLFIQTEMDSVINRVFNFISKQFQKIRPGRSYPRYSMKPETKWRPSKKKNRSKSVAIGCEVN